MAEIDIFIKNSIFPNADAIFSAVNNPLSKVKNDCLFVLDTNALLVPYYASSQDLEQIRSIFSSLIERQRLFIPGQVAREFASNRPDRIKEVFQQLNKRLNTMQEFQILNYPLLSNITEFKHLLKIESEFNTTVKRLRTKYKSQLNQVLKKIKEWAWNDPVSELYKELFTKEVVFDIPIADKEKLKNELERRYLHRIPPGYKDQSKMDEGIGDLLIWFTILEIGKKYKKSVVFVSGEEKSDWVLKSDGQTLYPRFELVAEFSLGAPNKSFHIIKLSELLELMTGSTKLINEIKGIESSFNNRTIFFDRNSIAHQEFENFIEYQVNIELDSIKKTVYQFLSDKEPGLLRSEDFQDDLTTLHRRGILPYNIYKRLMSLYGVYGRKETLPYETHSQNLEEIRLLKISIFEALANAF